MGRQIHQWARSKFTFSISVSQDDYVYSEVHRWLLEQTNQTSVRALNAKTERDWEDGPRLRYLSDDQRSHHLQVGQHKVGVSLERPDLSEFPRTELLQRKIQDRIVFVCKTAEARNAVQELLASLLKQRDSGSKDPEVRIVDRWGSWTQLKDLRRRELESVVLRKGVAEDIQEDLSNFLQSEEKYVSRYLPYHRGYLLDGPPGVGKTSLVRALANANELDLCYLPLGDINKDVNLISLVGEIRPRSILLLEDVDIYHAATEREDGEGASLSGLLNSLDGIFTPHGLITFATTNNSNALDEALLRAGRIDRKFVLELLDADQATRLFEYFYGRRPLRPLKFGPDTSSASMLEHFKKYMDSPEMAESVSV